jgi:glycosyltransferase 2 family protein
VSHGRRSPAWALAGRVAVSAGLLWLVSRRLDVAAVLDRLTALRPGWILLGLGITVLQVAVLAWRWRLTAARLGVHLPFGVALGEYYLGILLNQVLPGGVLGDVSRAWRHTRAGAESGPAVRAVVLERASAQLVMSAVAIASLLALPWAPAPVRLVIAVPAAALLTLVLRSLARRPAPASAAGRFWADARHAVLAPEVLGTQLASALVVVASYIAVFVVAARAVGAEVPLGTLLPLVAPVLMTMLVPVTVAGWGVREAAAATLWGLVGLRPEDGAAISVAYGLLVLLSSAPGVVVLIRVSAADRGRRAHPPRA